MAGNLNIKNANGKTLTIQNPDTNNADIVIDGSKIASTVSPELTGNPTAPTPTVGDNSIKIATTAFANSLAIGVNQTLQTFTVGTQRISGTTYTNSTGKLIMLFLNININTGGGATMVIGGISTTINVGYSGVGIPYTILIPNGVTYNITAPQGITLWMELR